ncbi:MAG: Fic family protein [Verrucomicrobia bacterium]|nr:Fic family protein [Verrucomicrobiota bacterium]
MKKLVEDEGYKPQYTLTESIVALVAQIAEAAGKVSLTGEQALRLRRVNRIRTIHGSVAIEGNTLTEEQITAILEGKRVIAPPHEILEVQNAIKAYEQLSGWKPEKESDLLKAHAVLMAGLLEDAGKYRKKNAGIMGKEGVIHIAPPADRLPYLMKQLFCWLKETKVHPLIAGAVFHYEFEFIHPFADGNGRTGRLWQTLILSRWNPVFGDIAVESMIHAHQPDYYNAINQSNAQNSSTPFVEFILKVILETLTAQQVTQQATQQVMKLMKAMKAPVSRAELMKALKLKDRVNFSRNYLEPALSDKLIEKTEPDSPNSPTQKYRLTEKGKRLLNKNT